MADSEVHKQSSEEDESSDDAWMVGIIVWLFGSAVIVPNLWDRTSHWDFLLVWVACAFVALVALLVQAVWAVKPQPENTIPDNDAWKFIVCFQIVFSLLGPAALLACAMWFMGFLFRSVKRGVTALHVRA